MRERTVLRRFATTTQRKENDREHDERAEHARADCDADDCAETNAERGLCRARASKQRIRHNICTLTCIILGELTVGAFTNADSVIVNDDKNIVVVGSLMMMKFLFDCE